jgi:hypothetical protein
MPQHQPFNHRNCLPYVVNNMGLKHDEVKKSDDDIDPGSGIEHSACDGCQVPLV